MTKKIDEHLKKSTEDLREKLRRLEQLQLKRKRVAESAEKVKLKKMNYSKMLVVGRMALAQTDEETMRTTLSTYLTDEDERELFGLPPLKTTIAQSEIFVAPVLTVRRSLNDCLTDVVENAIVELPEVVKTERWIERNSATDGIEPERSTNRLSHHTDGEILTLPMSPLIQVDVQAAGIESSGLSHDIGRDSVELFLVAEPDLDSGFLID